MYSGQMEVERIEGGTDRGWNEWNLSRIKRGTEETRKYEKEKEKKEEGKS